MDVLPISIDVLDHLIGAMTHTLIESIYGESDLRLLFEIQRLPDTMKLGFITNFAHTFNTLTDGVFLDVSCEIMHRLVECMDTALHVMFKINRERFPTKDDVYETLIIALEDLVDLRGSGAVLLKCYLALE
jgi:hypothetical protein